jgi:octaprenyl-diphosphate synthase
LRRKTAPRSNPSRNFRLFVRGRRKAPAPGALLLLAAGASGYRGASAIRLGAVVEMIHSATLIHDDVIDGANTRRGRPSTNARWGNHMSVLAGDWLYMQSFEMALRERNFEILDILIDLTQNMVEGELLQLTRLGRIDLTETEATELAFRKTACLFSGCARLGAVLGNQPKHVSNDALAEYGRNAGLAFQLVDDLLDFTASPEQLGKPVLSDLKEGKVTLPLIFALEAGVAPHGGWRQRARARRRPRLVAKVLEERDFRSVRPEEIAKLVQQTGALGAREAGAGVCAAREGAWKNCPTRITAARCWRCLISSSNARTKSAAQLLFAAAAAGGFPNRTSCAIKSVPTGFAWITTRSPTLKSLTLAPAPLFTNDVSGAIFTTCS